MSVLIQKSSVKQFLSGSGKWVTFPEKAEDFGDVESALAFAKEYLPWNVEIVCHEVKPPVYGSAFTALVIS